MKKKICIIVGNYYSAIANNLLLGSIRILKDKNISYKKIIAPGIFEIPYIISKNINKYDAFIALGCVIKGKTSHYYLISKATTDAIMHLSIVHKKPIGNGIISCFNKKQAVERSNPKIKNKGTEAARAILNVLGI